MNALFLTGYAKSIKRTNKVTMFSIYVKDKMSDGSVKTSYYPVKVFDPTLNIQEGHMYAILNAKLDRHEYQGKWITEIKADSFQIYEPVKRNDANSIPPGYPIPPSDPSDSWRGDTPAMMPPINDSYASSPDAYIPQEGVNVDF